MDEKAKVCVDHGTAAWAPPPPSMIVVAGPLKAWLLRDDHFCMSTEGFDLVDWWAVQRLMDKFLEMVCLWASKHMSWF
jgi:hypothetical protein